MRRARSTLRACTLAVAALLALAGCGDSALWARWRAERGLARAERLLARVQVNPRLAPEADVARAAAACRRLVAEFPPAAWAGPAGRSTPGREIVTASGRAALALARLDALRGRTDAALEGYARVRTEWSEVLPVAIEAAVSRARLLERSGRVDEAVAAWLDLAHDFPPAEPQSGRPLPEVMDAPLFAARDRLARGERAAADSLLRDAERTWTDAAARERGRPAAPELWVRLADARTARGDAAGARDALRQALAEPAGGVLAPRLVLTLAQRALEAGAPDTALAYTAWAERGFGGAAAPEARQIAARAWEVAGRPDSALEAWERVLDAGPASEDEDAGARFERARLLESLGRWEQARGEYRALASGLPTHRLAFAALLRIVRHHRSRGEHTLAGMEARHALEAVDALIASQHDDSIQVRAGQARAEILFETGDETRACGTLAGLVRRYPAAALDPALLLRAAGAAETRLANPDLALEFYRDLAARAADPELRRRARGAADRLRRAPG
ncbi:MAG: hypothetical protein HZC42_06250 [Candidatus Eisenbacteria bacterium]|nr:hypothetical protein [Candidatus Eisenbacteria bacterium]